MKPLGTERLISIDFPTIAIEEKDIFFGGKSVMYMDFWFDIGLDKKESLTVFCCT